MTASAEREPMEDRSELLHRYQETHGRHIDGSEPEKREWFRRHVRSVYAGHLPPARSEPAILELACGPGFMLEGLRELGYNHLTGVDLSAADLDAARRRLPDLDLVEADVHAFLEERPATYDVVIAKALLEHVPKARVIPLVRSIHRSLRPGGVAMIEVPNMDWLLSGHERFMDFTHEVGFTRESLGQVLRMPFDQVAVLPVPPTELRGRKYQVTRAILWPVARRVLQGFLILAGGDGEHVLWEYRSILGVARREGASPPSAGA